MNQITTTQLKRVFKLGAMTLADPNPSLSIDRVKAFYGRQYPEMNSGIIEGPTVANGVATYTLLKAVGVKGTDASGSRRRMLKQIRQRIRGQESGLSHIEALMRGATPSEVAGAELCALKLNAVCSATAGAAGGRPVSVPSAAYGLWG